MLPNSFLCFPIDNEAFLHWPSEGQLTKILTSVKVRPDISAFVACAARNAVRYHSAIIVRGRLRRARHIASFDCVCAVIEDECFVWRRDGGFPGTFLWHVRADYVGETLGTGSYKVATRVTSATPVHVHNIFTQNTGITAYWQLCIGIDDRSVSYPIGSFAMFIEAG